MQEKSDIAGWISIYLDYIGDLAIDIKKADKKGKVYDWTSNLEVVKNNLKKVRDLLSSYEKYNNIKATIGFAAVLDSLNADTLLTLSNGLNDSLVDRYISSIVNYTLVTKDKEKTDIELDKAEEEREKAKEAFRTEANNLIAFYDRVSGKPHTKSATYGPNGETYKVNVNSGTKRR